MISNIFNGLWVCIAAMKQVSLFASCTNFLLTYNFLLHLDHKGPLSYIPKEDLKQTWNAMMDAMSLEPYLQLQNDKLYPQYLHYNNTGNWSSHCFPNPNAASINSASTKEFKECQNVNAKIMLPSHSMLQPGFYCYTTTRKPLVHAISSQNMLHNEKVTSVSGHLFCIHIPLELSQGEWRRAKINYQSVRANIAQYYATKSFGILHFINR